MVQRRLEPRTTERFSAASGKRSRLNPSIRDQSETNGSFGSCDCRPPTLWIVCATESRLRLSSCWRASRARFSCTVERVRGVSVRGAIGLNRRRAAQQTDGLLGSRVTLGDLVPVDDVPPGLQVRRAGVLVGQVVSVLPDVVAEQRRLAVGQRAVLVGAAGDRERSAVEY